MASKSEYSDPLPSQRRQKFTSGTYRGAYSALNTDCTFTKPASSDSFESDFIGAGEPAPAVGGVDDGRG